MNIFILQFFVLLLNYQSISSDSKKLKEDIKMDFNLIFSVAKFYEVKAIILLRFNDSDPLFVGDLLKTSSFYFSVIDSKEFKGIQLGPERTMAICYGYSSEKCGSLQHLQLSISRFRKVIWFVMCSYSPDDLQSLYIPFNYQFIVAEKDLIKNEFLLKEMYKFCSESELYFSALGSWKEPNTLKLTEESFFQRRSNFRREEVRIIPNVPDTTGAASSSIPEYEPGIWWSMQQRLNATSRAVSASSRDYDLNVNIDHPHGCQPLPTIMKIRSKLFYKAVTGNHGLSGFIQPFSWNIWLCTAGFILISSASMIFVNKYRIFLKENFHFFFLDALYIFLQQGSQITDNRSSFFIIKTLQLFHSLLIFSLYASVLISFITVVVSKPPFIDLEGILENGRYNILAIERRGRVIFQQSPGIVRELYIKHVPPVQDSPKTFFEAFYRVCFGKTTVLAECALDLAPKILSALPGRCRVDYVPFTTLKRTFSMQEGNRFEEVFRVCITKMLESEAVGNIFWSKALGLVKPDKNEDFKSITFSEVSSLFFIFIVGVVSASIILVIEIN